MQGSFRLTALSCAFFLVAGCSSQQMQDLKHSAQAIGKDYGMPVLCGVGVLAGGAAGYAMKGKDGAIIGAAAGGAVGCALGYVWQSRLQELDRIAKEENLRINNERLTVASGAVVTAVPKDAGLVTQIEDTGMFATGSHQLTESGKRAVGRLAQMYAKPAATDQQVAAKQLADRRLLVVGHSDATGSAAFNQQLSERRARTVGKMLVEAGIPAASIFYQGAGSSRPIADNSDPLVRGQNRRVEIVELANEQALVMRTQAEAGNTRYLRFGTSSSVKPRATASQPAKSRDAGQAPQVTGTPASRATVTRNDNNPPPARKAQPAVDFAGKPADAYIWSMAQNIKPKRSGFELISSAYASEMPLASCEADMPRDSGQVLSMVDGKPMQRHATKDYLPGYNNRVWANVVNGHLVTVSPVSILRENAQVDRQPILQVVKDYSQNSKNRAQTIKAVANTYEGESQVLYRVFTSDPKSAVSCMDLVFSKGNAKATEGALYYPAGSEAYIVSYIPVPATK